MCLIVLAWRVERAHPLIVAANRDEFHGRPAAPATFWKEHPEILAGRDLEAGGTWMGVSRSGRFAAVTNYRGGRDPAAKESRGGLVRDFLSGNIKTKQFMEQKDKSKSGYSGFNLLACDAEELWVLSNRDGGARKLEPGIYGLGNLLLDTPEVSGPKEDFARSIGVAAAEESLFGVLAKSKILGPEYGTRCSTVLVSNGRGLRYAERPFDAAGKESATGRFEFRAKR
jgi:uncharacterized protein with NRDE domain